MIEIQKAYVCEYCRKVYQRMHAAEKHELKCKKNPDNIAICHSCKYLDKVDATLYDDTPFGEFTRRVKVLYCSKLDTYVYPRWVQCDVAFDFGDKTNLKAKKECDHFNDSIDLFDIPSGRVIFE